MDTDHGDQILVTSPKKKVHHVNGKLARRISEDLTPMLGQANVSSDDDYDEESVEDTEEDDMEEIISSSEEDDSASEESDASASEESASEPSEASEESDASEQSASEPSEASEESEASASEQSEESASDESEEKSASDESNGEDSDYDVSDEIELESIEESESQDDSTSRSEFDPLPPPIHIPNALKPPHLRSEENSSHVYHKKDDDSSDVDGSSSDDDDSSFGGVPGKKKDTTATSSSAPSSNAFNYDDVDVSYDSDDSDTSASSADKPFTATSVTGKIDKNADDYDEDDSESSKEPEKPKETPKPKEQELAENPAVAVRPSSYRGNSFASDDEDLPEKVRRAGKKPSKWEDQPSSIYEQNGVSSVQKSNFSKPTETEPKPISEHRPADVLGQADSGASTLRDASAVQNESITSPASPVATEKEKAPTRKFSPIKKKEEKVEEEDWNTEPKDDGNGPYYSADDLRKQKIPGLDYLNREQYLSPYDFMATFKVKKSEYETWPKWKKTKAKRKVKLF